MQVEISNEQSQFPLEPPLVEYLEKAAQVTSETIGSDPAGEASIVLVDDEHIRELNKTYRHKDTATDVLSFAMLEEDEAEPKVLGLEDDHLFGDVFISMETAQRQAQEYGHSLAREVVFLAVHGMLHLLGFDHMTDEDRARMRQKEEEIMTKLELRRE